MGAWPTDRVEHGAVIPATALPALAALGVTVITQPGFVAERGDRYRAEVDEGEQPDLWRCATLLDGGVHVGAGTDAPYGPADPWRAMATAVNRRTPSGAIMGDDERLAPGRALGLFLGAADDLPAAHPGGSRPAPPPTCASSTGRGSKPWPTSPPSGSRRRSWRGSPSASERASEPSSTRGSTLVRRPPGGGQPTHRGEWIMATTVAPQSHTFERVASPPPVLMAMASLAAAAAVIHFVMVPSHMDEFSVEGVAFAVAGWLQLLVAFYLWTQPSRAILGFTILSNLGFMAVWAVSRTVGLPVGPHSGIAEEVSVVDLTCVALEAGLILMAIALLFRPRLAEVDAAPAWASPCPWPSSSSPAPSWPPPRPGTMPTAPTAWELRPSPEGDPPSRPTATPTAERRRPPRPPPPSAIGAFPC